MLNLERKFQSNTELRLHYSQFMREYIALRHMSILGDDRIHDSAYYLPHHVVLRSDSLTTKIRVVFNGSSPTSGTSLNDI